MKHLTVLRLLVLAVLCAMGAQAAIQFSGTSFSTTIVTTGTKQDLINAIETALLNGIAGWTTVSGSGTTNLLMLSGTTPQGLAIRARFKDNGGAGIQVYMEDSTSTHVDTVDTVHGGTLLATLGRTYQVIGSTYQFLIYLQGSNRSFVWVGMPYLPAFLGAVTDAGWMFSNSARDSDANEYDSIMKSTSIARSTAGNFEVMVDANYWSITNNPSIRTLQRVGVPRLVLNSIVPDFDAVLTIQTGYRWLDDSIMTGDCYLSWGLTNENIEAKTAGQIWDALYIADSVVINTTATFSAHDFQNVTNSSSGVQSMVPRGGLWFAIN